MQVSSYCLCYAGEFLVNAGEFIPAHWHLCLCYAGEFLVNAGEFIPAHWHLCLCYTGEFLVNAGEFIPAHWHLCLCYTGEFLVNAGEFIPAHWHLYLCYTGEFLVNAGKLCVCYAGGDVCGWESLQCVGEDGTFSAAVCWVAGGEDHIAPRLLAVHLRTDGKWLPLLVVSFTSTCVV